MFFMKIDLNFKLVGYYLFFNIYFVTQTIIFINVLIFYDTENDKQQYILSIEQYKLMRIITTKLFFSFKTLFEWKVK